MDGIEEEFPANHIAHWPTGPVFVCEKHANQLKGLGETMGWHVHTESLPEAVIVACKNCEREALKGGGDAVKSE